MPEDENVNDEDNGDIGDNENKNGKINGISNGNGNDDDHDNGDDDDVYNGNECEDNDKEYVTVKAKHTYSSVVEMSTNQKKQTEMKFDIRRTS